VPRVVARVARRAGERGRWESRRVGLSVRSAEQRGMSARWRAELWAAGMAAEWVVHSAPPRVERTAGRRESLEMRWVARREQWALQRAVRRARWALQRAVLTAARMAHRTAGSLALKMADSRAVLKERRVELRAVLLDKWTHWALLWAPRTERWGFQRAEQSAVLWGCKRAGQREMPRTAAWALRRVLWEHQTAAQMALSWASQKALQRAPQRVF
jgi:hypothetical protein